MSGPTVITQEYLVILKYDQGDPIVELTAQYSTAAHIMSISNSNGPHHGPASVCPWPLRELPRSVGRSIGLLSEGFPTH